jgi:hypothetical protein
MAIKEAGLVSDYPAMNGHWIVEDDFRTKEESMIPSRDNVKILRRESGD